MTERRDPIVVPGAGVPPHVIIDPTERRARRDVPATVRRSRRGKTVTDGNHVRITRTGNGPAGTKRRGR